MASSAVGKPRRRRKAPAKRLPKIARQPLGVEGNAREIEDTIKAAPTSLWAHARLCHRTDDDLPLVPARHQAEWLDVLEDPVAYPWVVIVAPPGYAKSTWFSQAYASWRIGASGGRVRIGMVANNATLAYSHAQVVQNTIESAWWRLAYPEVRPNYRRGWANDRFFVHGCPPGANPTMAAAGYRGPIQGRRFDEIILDDPTTFEESRSDVEMERQRQWLKNTLAKRFPAGRQPPHGKGGRMVVVLTRWAERDLVPTLTDDLGFKLVRMPALGYWDRRAECPNCGRQRQVDLHKLLQRCEHCDSEQPAEITYGDAPLWPELESAVLLEKERHDDELIFELVKQGNAKALSGDMFDTATFRRGHPPRGGWDMIVQYVDTAGGKDRKRGDFFAMVTLGRRGEQVWVLDVMRGRWPAPEQERRLEANAIEWDPEKVMIEAKNEGVALYQRLVARGVDLPLEMAEVTKDKEFRAIPLSNAYRAGYVWHPIDASWRVPFENELDAFPGGAHDDQVDAAAGAYAELDRGGPRVRVLTSA